ncbi:unnamed protein product [Bursaphelenchus xylophilus]|nr:unnamed protein product [Bursaphelenchus xylophilus]CAG9118558.1 unnamed protein product [Bursaphelenchus xylophilus]
MNSSYTQESSHYYKDGVYRDSQGRVTYPPTVYYNDRHYKPGHGPTYYVREDVRYDEHGRPIVYRRGVDNGGCRFWPICCCFPCIPCCFPVCTD